MRRVAWIVAVALSLALANGCKKQEAATHEHQPGAPAATQPAIAQKTCPVMGSPINPKIYVDYEGRRIYFCCSMCPDEFKKDPQKYLKKVDEELKRLST